MPPVPMVLAACAEYRAMARQASAEVSAANRVLLMRKQRHTCSLTAAGDTQPAGGSGVRILVPHLLLI